MKVRLAQFQMDNGAAFFLKFLGAAEDRQCAFAGQL